jgi:hypothetical protein
MAIHFPKFLKNAFSFKEGQETSPNHYTISPAASIYSSSSSSPAASMKGYIRDPTRCGSNPDIVGQYYDPMGGKFSYCQGKDATNTGA